MLVVLGKWPAPAMRVPGWAPVVSTRRSARTNPARSTAACSRSPMVPLAFSPGSHSYTDHSKG
jgi:hypothetical protein